MFTKWDHDYNESMKLAQMENDGQRFRWWRMVTLSNKMSFPGLLANNSLQPYKEWKLISEIYSDKEFEDPKKGLDIWRKEKQFFLNLGVLKSYKTDGVELLWNNEHHYYQDKETRWEASLGRKFVEAFEKFQDEKRILYLQLLFAFRPKKITVCDFRNDDLLDIWEDEWKDVKMTRKSANSIEVCRADGQIKILKIENLCLLYRHRGLYQKKEPKIKNPDIKKFIDWWFQNYPGRFGKYDVTGKDPKQVQIMLRSFKYDDLVGLAKKFFATDDDFLRRAGYTIGVFKSRLNQLNSAKRDKWEEES